MSFHRLVIPISVLVLLTLLVSCSLDPNVRKRKFYESGQTYLQKGRYEEAQIQFRNAVKLDPRFTDAYWGLYRADLALKRADAFTDLQKVIALDPNRIEAHLEIGKLYLAAGEYNRAKSSADEVLSRDQNNAAAHDLLATVYLARKDFARAHEEFQQQSAAQPSSDLPLINMALTDVALGRQKEAEEHLGSAILLKPSSTGAYFNLATIYATQRDYGRAVETLKKGIAAAQNPEELYRLWAEIVYSTGDTARAEQVLNTLRASRPSSVLAAKIIGDFYKNRSMIPQAIAEYQRALKIQPADLEIQGSLVDLYLDSNQLQDATRLNDAILQKSPKDVGARVRRGRILLANGNAGPAITELRGAVADAPESPWAHYTLGAAYAGTGQIMLARSEFDSALRYAPDMVPALRSLAALNFNVGDLAAARQNALQVLDHAPLDSVCRMILGSIELRSGKPVAARVHYSALLRQTPPDPMAFIGIAETYAAEKRWSDAEKQFETALRTSPDSTTVLDQYLKYLKARNQGARADRLAASYAAAHTTNPAAQLVLANLLVDAKKYAQAQAASEAALRLDPKLLEAYLILGRIFQEQGELDKAIGVVEKARSLNPNLEELELALGDLYYLKSDQLNARKHYEQALAINPQSGRAAGNLAYLYSLTGGNLDVALSLAQRAKQLMPEEVSVADTLGWVYFSRGSYQMALPILADCARRNPNSPTYHYHLGMTLIRMGNKRQGASELQHALNLKLSGADAEMARLTLNQN